MGWAVAIRGYGGNKTRYGIYGRVPNIKDPNNLLQIDMH